jgi:hypothetical protein
VYVEWSQPEGCPEASRLNLALAAHNPNKLATDYCLLPTPLIADTPSKCLLHHALNLGPSFHVPSSVLSFLNSLCMWLRVYDIYSSCMWLRVYDIYSSCMWLRVYDVYSSCMWLRVYDLYSSCMWFRVYDLYSSCMWFRVYGIYSSCMWFRVYGIYSLCMWFRFTYTYMQMHTYVLYGSLSMRAKLALNTSLNHAPYWVNFPPIMYEFSILKP